MVDESDDPALQLTELDTPTNLAQTPADDEPAPAAAEDPIREYAGVTDIRRYRVVREFARGGLGRILEADDQTLGRKVAIKELRVAGGRGQARFLREATITARLQHPAIVPLYDVGRWESGEPYYSMKLVAGRALDAVIRDAKTLDGRLALLPHVIAVADAMSYAHSQRIIHRDLKPANVLVGDFGETIVIDWGLAKDLSDDNATDANDGPFRTPEAEPALTVDGELLGTPVYMAPEQAMGKDLDERADVYAIGAILYELLTGAWPHRGASSAQVIAQLVSGEAVTPIEQTQPGAPPELIAIVNKAMAYERDGRYRTASELAQEIRRFHTGQLVAAHHYSKRNLLVRWARRHRAPIAVGAVLTAALAATATVSVRSIIHERDATQTERDATRAERDRLILVKARGELEHDPTAAVAWLKTYPATGADQKEATELALEARAAGVATYVLPVRRGTSGRLSFDGRRFAWPDEHGVNVIELESGRRTQVMSGPATQVAWSHDGDSLLVQRSISGSAHTIVHPADATRAELSGTIQSWPSIDVDPFDRDDGGVLALDAAGALVRFDRKGGTAAVTWAPGALVRLSRQGKNVAAQTSDGSRWWWELGATSAKPLLPPSGIALTDNVLMLIGNGKQVVAATVGGAICVWSIEDGTRRVLDGHSKADILGLFASADGKIAVALHSDSALSEFDLETGEMHGIVSPGTINDVSISADGRVLAIAQDRDLYLVDLQTREPLHVGRHPAAIREVALSTDAGWLVSYGDDGSVRLWRRAGSGVGALANLQHEPVSLAVAPDGTRIALGVAGDPNIRVMNVSAPGRPLLLRHDDVVAAAAFASDGRTLATISDRSLRIWDLATTREAHAPLEIATVRRGGLVSLRTRPGFVVADSSGTLRTFDPQTWGTRVLSGECSAGVIAISANDEFVSCIRKDGAVLVVPERGGAVTAIAVTNASAIALAPDGRTLTVGTSDGDVAIWNVETRTARSMERVEAAIIRHVEFSSDGTWLVAVDTDGAAALWSARDARPTPQLRLDGVTSVAFAPAGSGSELAIGRRDGEVRIIEPARGSLRDVTRVPSEVAELAVSSQGNTVVVATQTGIVEVWSRSAATNIATAGRVALGSLTTAELDRRGDPASP